ncbi:hypothetical protein M0802_000879 [Mischocyttarus mexicanus]|nr:hypothetical protein M0802_000879 [Mischocyttarus mexicanus]
MMGWQMLLLLIGLCTLRSGLASDLQIIINSIDVEANEEYVPNCKIDACDNDEMIPIIKVKCDFKDIPIETKFKCELYGMDNGEPTVPTGFQIEMTVCEMLNDTSFIGQMTQLLNIPMSCPMKATYIDTDCSPIPMENLPDFFPSGDYKFNFVFDRNTDILFEMNMYLSFY